MTNQSRNAILSLPYTEDESIFKNVITKGSGNWREVNGSVTQYIKKGKQESLGKMLALLFEEIGGKRIVLEALFPGVGVFLEIYEILNKAYKISNTIYALVNGETVNFSSVVDLTKNLVQLINFDGSDKYSSVNRRALLYFLDSISKSDIFEQGKHTCLDHYSKEFVARHYSTYVLNFVEHKFEDNKSVSVNDLLDRKKEIQDYFAHLVDWTSSEDGVEFNSETLKSLYEEIINIISSGGINDES